MPILPCLPTLRSATLLMLGLTTLTALAQTNYTTDTTITTTVDLGSGEANVYNNATLTVTGAGNLQTTGIFKIGAVSGASNGTLVISGGGQVSSGNTTIAEGVFGSGDGFATVTGAGSVWSVTSLTVGNYGKDGELTLGNGGTVNVGSGAGTLQLGDQHMDQAPTGTLNIGAAAADAATGAGVLNAASVYTAQGTSTLQFNHTGTTYFTKDGTSGGTGITTGDDFGTLSLIHTAGTTYFTGTLAHEGTTTINGGIAHFNSAVSSSAVTVNSGGGIGGGGLLGNGLTLNNGSSLHFALGSDFDSLDITGGNLVFNGAITINLTDAGDFDAGATYNLIDASSASSISSFDTGIFTINDITGYTHSLAWNGNILQLTTALSAVPEPSSYAAILGGLALGFVAWRRRHSAA